MVEDTVKEETEQSKKAAKKAAKDAVKAAKVSPLFFFNLHLFSFHNSLQKAEHKAAAAAEKGLQETVGDESKDYSVGLYGVTKMIQSTTKHSERNFIMVHDLSTCGKNTLVWVRGRVHTSRAKGKQCFLVLRQQSSTVQCVLAVNESTVSKQMVKFSGSIPRESIVDIKAKVIPVENKIESCTEQNLELHVEEIFLVSAAKAQLPLQIEDAARPEKSDDPEALKIRVNQDTRLDNRVLDLRTPANQAIFRLEAGVCKLFRDILANKGFTEIHTPKIISAASEGGANVFTVSYFKGKNYSK